MSPWTLPKYLLGSRRAILDLAASRWSVGAGVLLVLSAGLAREYDGEDLLHEPWHALRPLAASLASGTLLFLVVHLAALMRSHAADRSRAGDGDGAEPGEEPGFVEAWWRFMGLFWLTAPMAWLYAVPYERMMSPVDAIRLNLWTLALVALWRVALMIRVVHVLYGIRHVYAFFLVMAFADAVVFTVVTTVPTPVIDVMGGIRHSQRDALLASVTFTVTILSVLTAPVWIIGALASSAMLRPRWPRLPGTPDRPGPGARGLLIFAAGSILAFIPLLIIAQPEQINRRHAERLLAQGRVPEALAAMSQHTPDDYPPQWDPPPRLGYRESQPNLTDLQNAMTADWPADWVAQVYLAKIDRKLKTEIAPFSGYDSWEQIAALLQEYPDAYKVAPEHQRSAQFLHDHLDSLSDAEREALREIAQPAAAAEVR